MIRVPWSVERRKLAPTWTFAREKGMILWTEGIDLSLGTMLAATGKDYFAAAEQVPPAEAASTSS